jgi:hypothetical protein
MTDKCWCKALPYSVSFLLLMKWFTIIILIRVESNLNQSQKMPKFIPEPHNFSSRLELLSSFTRLNKMHESR